MSNESQSAALEPTPSRGPNSVGATGSDPFCVPAIWYDRDERMPEEGRMVSLLSYSGKVYQAKRNKRYAGGFEIQNCAGGESAGEYWGKWWTYTHVAKPTGTGNW